ncbi:unnamed protein product [Clavelina lepadiformis]|uniref:Uncharacterized protein n=1 Tax=Clavelina lepadiformis TaxID=159417 RepID=A0ABP0FD09_CLALP
MRKMTWDETDGPPYVDVMSMCQSMCTCTAGCSLRSSFVRSQARDSTNVCYVIVIFPYRSMHKHNFVCHRIRAVAHWNRPHCLALPVDLVCSTAM